MYGAEAQDFAEFENLDNTVFHAHVPGTEHEDRDAVFREQVFGLGHDFGHAHDINADIEWSDPIKHSGETAITIDPADPLPPNLPPPTRALNSATASRSLTIFTFLPLTLELVYFIARRFLPTHLPCTPCATFGIVITILMLLTMLPPAQTAHTINNRECAFPTYGLNSSTLDSYLLDSGCTTSIIADIRFLSDFRRIPTVSVSGLAGNKQYNWKATLTLPVKMIH
mmetsp:Transcript_62736/g.130405  ORF Transcript_62736/g.130405 Transcript_62736/m.130405 type:complete len:226 (-) Transcript_62736:1954-2631(-)